MLELTDSYKQSHAPQYPPNMDGMMSYFEARSGKQFPYTVFYGLQYIMKKYMVGKVVDQRSIDDAAEIVDAHMGPGIFNRLGWEYILDEYDGRLPIKICAVPEGTKVPISNVLMTVESTDPLVPWVPGFVETLLVQLWYPCTVATQSQEIRKIMNWYAEETGDPAGVPFKLHDFGCRGVSSMESAAIGGSAHLASFMGTDTMPALRLLRDYYGCKMAGFSIGAMEHSTVTSWGKENEVDAYRNMLSKFPNGLIACVSDSYDVYNACDNIWGSDLKDIVMARDGTVVVRLDSGMPLDIVMYALESLGKSYGYTINEKGYKVLDSHIRILQGDGVDKDLINSILGAMKHEKWSIDNIAFGAGGSLLQKLNRDTQQFAYKCCAISVNGKWQDVFKDPITSQAKRSKAGIIKLVKKNGSYETVSIGEPRENVLQPVFDTGELLVTTTFDEVRERANL